MSIGNLNNLEVLMHYHVSTEIHPRADAPEVQEAIAMLLQHRLITGQNQRYDTTEAGAFYLSQLTSTPFPLMVMTISKRSGEE